MTSILAKLFMILLPALVVGCATQQPSPPIAVNPSPPSNLPSKTKPVDATNVEMKYHRVQKNETLYSISRAFALRYESVALWNQIPPPYTIKLGQQLRLSDPNLHNKPIAINAISAQKSTTVLVNNTPARADKPLAVNNSVKKPLTVQQKKSIISIDNETMLKLNFQWPIKGKILKKFSRVDNKGIDIAATTEQNVCAAEAGKIVYSGEGPVGYGNLLIIKHNDRYLSAYANNSRLLVAKGHTVKKGDVIAQVGQAAPNKSMLHFEIRKNGKPVNPLKFLPEK